ncbi:30S ribosomal protein S21 [Inquilinus sp. YAF38]
MPTIFNSVTIPSPASPPSRALKKMQREGIFREMKLRRNDEKPSGKGAREQAEAVRRARKTAAKRPDREGYSAMAE